MFGIKEWRQTRFYQEVQEETELETKLKTVPRLLQVGLSIEQIAQALELDIELVREVVNKHNKESKT
ncbi:hypothetical protein CAL7716_004070 [Calothrix sp. PCC 7716]|nr:hypothetical protein CAL7716_004070 [Calothrix sp. PCC 7716]